MAQLSQSSQQFKDSGAAFFAISNETGADLKKMQAKHNLDFITFLSDPNGTIAKLYPGANPGETAATFVIGKDKNIAYAYVNDDYTTRAATDAVLKTLSEAK